MSQTLIPLPELNRRAFAILSRELGVPDTLRVFDQLGLGHGDYTKERQSLFENLTIEEVRRGVAELRGATDS